LGKKEGFFSGEGIWNKGGVDTFKTRPQDWMVIIKLFSKLEKRASVEREKGGDRYLLAWEKRKHNPVGKNNARGDVMGRGGLLPNSVRRVLGGKKKGCSFI